MREADCHAAYGRHGRRLPLLRDTVDAHARHRGHGPRPRGRSRRVHPGSADPAADGADPPDSIAAPPDAARPGRDRSPAVDRRSGLRCASACAAGPVAPADGVVRPRGVRGYGGQPAAGSIASAVGDVAGRSGGRIRGGPGHQAPPLTDGRRCRGRSDGIDLRPGARRRRGGTTGRRMGARCRPYYPPPGHRVGDLAGGPPAPCARGVGSLGVRGGQHSLDLDVTAVGRYRATAGRPGDTVQRVVVSTPVGESDPGRPRRSPGHPQGVRDDGQRCGAGRVGNRAAVLPLGSQCTAPSRSTGCRAGECPPAQWRPGCLAEGSGQQETCQQGSGQPGVGHDGSATGAIRRPGRAPHGRACQLDQFQGAAERVRAGVTGRNDGLYAPTGDDGGRPLLLRARPGPVPSAADEPDHLQCARSAHRPLSGWGPGHRDLPHGSVDGGIGCQPDRPVRGQTPQHRHHGLPRSVRRCRRTGARLRRGDR